MFANTDAYVCRGQRTATDVILQTPSKPFEMETIFSPVGKLEANHSHGLKVGWWSVNRRNPPASVSSMLRLNLRLPCPAFYISSRDLVLRSCH